MHFHANKPLVIHDAHFTLPNEAYILYSVYRRAPGLIFFPFEDVAPSASCDVLGVLGRIVWRCGLTCALSRCSVSLGALAEDPPYGTVSADPCVLLAG